MPEIHEDPNRNADGTWKEGNTAGSPDQKGRTTWRKRVEQLDIKYDTLEKLMALFIQDSATGKMRPGPDMMRMHHRDVALIMQAINACMGDDKRAERESFWDRDEGKPMQRNEFSGPNGGAIAYADATQARELLLRGSLSGPAAANPSSSPSETDQSATGKPAV